MPDCVGGHADSPEPEWTTRRRAFATACGHRFHKRRLSGMLRRSKDLPSGYGEGAVMMGVEPVNTAVETLPVPRIRFLRV